LRQGEYPVLAVSGSYDGSKRFSKWQAYSEDHTDDTKSGITKTMEDKTVPVNRGFVFKATEAEDKNITTAVQWRMSKSIAEAISIPVSVAGWRNAEGELWKENTMITLFAPGAFVITESKMITESVELTKDEGGGDVTNLQLVIPESYTTTMPKSPFPWSGSWSSKRQKRAGELEAM
jgi:prophage tail gpP-like protein